MRNFSFYCFLFSCLFLLATHFMYYPKWQKTGTEATISWDVSGYYLYLPALFIYNDLKNYDYYDEILEEYQPTPDFQQAFVHEPSGNRVIKYPLGQAIQFSPFFFIADLWAANSTAYDRDGYSFPYQFMISIGSLIIAFLGLFYLRKVLLHYFDDKVVGISLLCLVLGTNYLNYSAIDGAMTHNNLFTIYALLIYMSIHFYKNPTLIKSLAIGLLVGLAALTRPTEIISFLIPVLWGAPIFNRKGIRERWNFFRRHHTYIWVALISCIAVGSLQLLYWKYVSNEWIVYSYQDQGFSWLSPHIYQGMFSYKSGWLMYSPLMIFSLLGFFSLYKNHKKIFPVCLVFSGLFIYIVFAWDIWWYGGSLGQRAMVQAYPVLFIAFSAFIQWVFKHGILSKSIITAIFLLFIYLNLWFTHQVHLGGLLPVGQITQEYYWKVLGTFENNPDDRKLLDTDEYFDGQRENVRLLYQTGFESLDSNYYENQEGDSTNKVLLLDEKNQFSPELRFQTDQNFEWIRVKADVRIEHKEWDVWKMTQMTVQFLNEEGEVLKQKLIRVQRLLHHGQEREVYIDLQAPETPFSSIKVQFWNADGKKPIWIDNVQVEAFDSKTD